MLSDRKSDKSENIQKVYSFLGMLFAGLMIFLLVDLFSRIETFGNASMYAATWVTFVHICIGEFVLLRYLRAYSVIQRSLDLLAALFLAAGIYSFTSPGLWCALFGGVFALAVTKYMILMRSTKSDDVERYCREKVIWETPAVAGLVILALLLDRLPSSSSSWRFMQFAVLAATTAFAVWMIAIRHVYQRIAGRKKDLSNPM